MCLCAWEMKIETNAKQDKKRESKVGSLGPSQRAPWETASWLYKSLESSFQCFPNDDSCIVMGQVSRSSPRLSLLSPKHIHIEYC